MRKVAPLVPATEAAQGILAVPARSRQQKSGLRFRRNERPPATTQPLNRGSSRWLQNPLSSNLRFDPPARQRAPT
jgi:hypothetical protein